jgi:hypothetical protein
MKRHPGIFFVTTLLALSLTEARIQSEERMLQYQASPRKLTNCFSCVANGYAWRQASCVNEFLPKIDKVYDADSLEECYNIWRSKKL